MGPEPAERAASSEHDSTAVDLDPDRETAYDHRDLASLLTEDDVAQAARPRRLEAADLAVDPAADPDGVFPQSVASGGPTPDGVILWTRLDPAAYDPDRPLFVQVAHDETFEQPVYEGAVEDPTRIRSHDHTVKVDLSGVLAADTSYRYRFVHDGTASRVGRCHTLPEPTASPDSLRIGVLTCQNYLNGYYGAFEHLAEDDLDFLVHVGDFIYESATGEFKGVGSPDMAAREHRVELPSGEDRVHTLADYRYVYRTYRSDPALRRALEAHTLVPAWDDHEMVDDVYWDPAVEAPAGDHPNSDDPEFMTRLVADAVHAWWEYMPARVDYDPEADSLHERFELWRSLRYGDLVDLVMTDERLYRSPPRESRLQPSIDPGREPRDRSMLGTAQREWFVEEIESVDATWTVWTDEVLTVPMRVGVDPLAIYPVQGGWDGYARERAHLTAKIREADLDNFVTLTGDMHCYVAGYKQVEYRNLLERVLRGPVPEDRRVGVEFMTPPVTSQTVSEALGLSWDPTPVSDWLLSTVVTGMNPHLAYFNSDNWGYSVVEFTRDDCTYVGYSVDKSVPAPEADREVQVALRVPEGRVHLEDVTEAVRREGLPERPPEKRGVPETPPDRAGATESGDHVSQDD
jgi:alkaline phosphatase D